MSDRGPNQDQVPLGRIDKDDPTYRQASYLGTDQEDEEEVRDLGFIVEDHDDRRTTLTENWQRLDELDTNEPLETNRSGPIPHAVSLREDANPPELFASDYNISNADGEEQEEDFVATSLLSEDPEMNDGIQDFTDETLEDEDGDPIPTDILGRVAGVADGAGTTLPQDLGSEGFQITDNPLVETPFDRAAIQGRESGQGELDDYDDDKQQDARDRVDMGADLDVHQPSDPSLRGRA
jgi:hypothetical protein